MAAMTRLTYAALDALKTTQLQNLKPYQLEQVIDYLNRLNYDRKSGSNISAQATIGTILTAQHLQNA